MDTLLFLYGFGLFIGFVAIVVVADEYETGVSFPEQIAAWLFWPLCLVGIALYGVFMAAGRVVGGNGSELSRKQRRELEFDRQKAEIAQQALETQRTYERLIMQEGMKRPSEDK